ncbi:MAG: FxsA family protein [Actinobacteria bacterium]|nr:FxsA family protein [Actinomycetota bacterium]
MTTIPMALGAGGLWTSGSGSTVPGGTMGTVVGVFTLLFVLAPLLELYVIIQVGQTIGALNTIALLLLVSVVGAWLVKREGMSVWRRFQHQVQAGIVPGREIADGVMILFAGALLLTPGFVSDVLAILLLLPPVRATVRAAVLRRAARRAGLVRFHRA